MTNLIRKTLFAAAMAIGLGAIGWSPSASATALNIDFGNQGPGVAPSSSFGAASGQVGVWNNITAFVTGAGIVDTTGAATGVAISITAATMGGFLPLPSGDANDLMADNFFDGNSWSLSMTGLSNGLYDVYLYEPHNSLVGTGAGTLNGVAFGDINGNFSGGTFTAGSNFHLLSGVTVAGGLLTASAVPVLSSSCCSGLSGLQLVPLFQAQQVPEPGTLTLFGLGLAGLGYMRRRRAI